MVRPDERAVMTYLSCFYHAFQGLHQVKLKSTIKHCLDIEMLFLALSA